ncbi:MarR family transcriptional regulator [Streptomyces sp. NBC_00249]|uniref:MarR family winged helix-turn-helix transcriptional regulator n=1 Tax=Streptomyces sp. NBC_00249 TaxID=2975690 RepID=UPI00225C2FD6|nr:MarR family transcriptional regulator [Streptomyces sp. NBC_00249]MCX5196657.1 MarR family transcriptional regulator [Streptomyces sp. NBC_00249]
MEIKEYPEEQVAAQAIGYWTGAANRIIVGGLRTALAEESLTQPHWWILNHIAGAPDEWTAATLTAKLTPYDDQNLDFDAIHTDLADRGWTRTSGDRLTLTPAGEAARERARTRNAKVHATMRAGVPDTDYAATINVLRRLIHNLGGASDLPA